MAEENRWGTVFMGPTSDRESQLDKISNREEQDLWNRRTEAEYLRRVRDKAVEQLASMLAEAQDQAAAILATANAEAEDIRGQAKAVLDEARADRKNAADELAHAKTIRDDAYDEGYERGVEQAMLELDEQRAKIDATTLSVLSAMEQQCGNLFASWREELAALLRQSVETGLGWVLHEDKAELLEHLLAQSVDALEQRRRIVVRAHPDDAPAVQEVLSSVQRRFDELKSWDVQTDDTMSPGGLVVESASGKVDSRAETRREIVEQTLRHLTIPESAADQKAADAVHDEADKAGVPALETAVRDAEQRALERAEKAALLASQDAVAELSEAPMENAAPDADGLDPAQTGDAKPDASPGNGKESGAKDGKEPGAKKGAPAQPAPPVPPASSAEPAPDAPAQPAPPTPSPAQPASPAAAEKTAPKKPALPPPPDAAAAAAASAAPVAAPAPDSVPAAASAAPVAAPAPDSVPAAASVPDPLPDSADDDMSFEDIARSIARNMEQEADTLTPDIAAGFDLPDPADLENMSLEESEALAKKLEAMSLAETEHIAKLLAEEN